MLQDNQSSLLLEKNGRGSSGKRTRHINIRFFFIADRIKNGELRVEYCPTEDMIADYFTKPLQGSLFKRLRDTILNISDSTVSKTVSPRSVLKNNDHSQNDHSPSSPSITPSPRSVPVGGQASWVEVVKGKRIAK